MHEHRFSDEISFGFKMMHNAVFLLQQIGQIGQCAQHLKDLLIG